MIQSWTLNRELEHWAAAGRRLQLWWRDDDARTPTGSLVRLLSMSRRYETPLTLAVVPDWERGALAARLASERRVVVIQHGVDHLGAHGRSVRRAEFPDRYPREVMETRLEDARRRLADMPRFASVFAPAWNAIHPDLARALRASGYLGLSAFGQDMSSEQGLTRIDTHLSLLSGYGDGGFRGADDFLSRFVKLARDRRRAGRWDEPIGLLTHHLDQDEAAWRCLEDFLDRTAGSIGVRWRSINELLSRGQHHWIERARPVRERAALLAERAGTGGEAPRRRSILSAESRNSG